MSFLEVEDNAPRQVRMRRNDERIRTFIEPYLHIHGRIGEDARPNGHFLYMDIGIDMMNPEDPALPWLQGHSNSGIPFGSNVVKIWMPKPRATIDERGHAAPAA